MVQQIIINDPVKQRVIEGVDFMLEHFSSELNTKNGHPLFPWTVATLATEYRQVQVNSREKRFVSKTLMRVLPTSYDNCGFYTTTRKCHLVQ